VPLSEEERRRFEVIAGGLDVSRKQRRLARKMQRTPKRKRRMRVPRLRGRSGLVAWAERRMAARFDH
jgi:hypothetical protein